MPEIIRLLLIDFFKEFNLKGETEIVRFWTICRSHWHFWDTETKSSFSGDKEDASIYPVRKNAPLLW